MNLVPYRVRWWLRCRASELVLPMAIRELHRAQRLPPARGALARLRFGWNNDSFVADVDYLHAIAAAASPQQGNILECGSGLSTIVLAAVAKGAQVWTLEHSREWLEKLQDTLRRHGLAGRVQLRHAPLKSYGEFSWYQPPADLPANFSLVVCDGPPAVSTPGGRYGLLPVMHERIRGAQVLLDDAQRAEEQQAIALWRERYGVEVQSPGEFCCLRVH
ncbi:MAG: hypothetical protein ACRD5F_08325 [Candidatus Acidiferrales bacterium]